MYECSHIHIYTNPDLFPAPFQEPKLEINQSNKTATCSTKGGYPKPEIEWTSQDGRDQSERTLEQHEVQTTMNTEENGTYSISSTANITGSQRVTCRVHNPTSNQTLSVTDDMTGDEKITFDLFNL